jgi:hypothetical protein
VHLFTMTLSSPRMDYSQQLSHQVHDRCTFTPPIRLQDMVLINNFSLFYSIILPAVALGEHDSGISFMKCY